MQKHKGQILLITVMLLATIMTVLLSVTFQSTTETQVTKLEEESQKSLAAAEAAIEAALKSGTTATIGEGTLSSLTGFTGSATVESTTSDTFTSPIVAKDGAYTFYLGEYNLINNTIGDSTDQDIIVCFNSSSTNPAIEITLLKTSEVKKYVIDPDSRIANTYSSSSGCSADSSFEYSYTVPGSDIETDGKLMLVRVLYASSKLVFYRSSDLPLQGKTITSEATSTTGVSKKVVLFQSYPQIPVEFFTTSF